MPRARLCMTIPVFSARDIETAVSPHEAYDAVRDAFVAYARGEWSMPPKVYVTNYPAGDFRAMPAIGGGHALLKWVTSFPGNPPRGLPTVTGLVLLSDADDGRLLTVLDAAAVTALRTAAAGVLAADTLCRPGSFLARRDRNGGQWSRDGAHAGRPRSESRSSGTSDEDPPAASSRIRLGARVAASAAEALACEVVLTVTPGADVLYAGRLARARPAHLAHGRRRARQGRGRNRGAPARAHVFCDDWEQAGSKGIGEVGLAAAAGHRAADET